MERRTADAIEPEKAQHPDGRHHPRLPWFRQARFGAFIHWGLYSLPDRWTDRPAHSEAMTQEEPSEEVIASIESAIRWFNEVKLENQRLVRVQLDPADYPDPTITTDVRIVPDPNAPPLWARYYDLETMRPFFANRDGIKVHRLEDVLPERRIGFEWYGHWAPCPA